jgi:predicted enzyme related to lactoylglutathione lyase
MQPECVKFLLMVADMDRAVRFYGEVLGFQPGYTSPYWSEVRLGDVILGLHGGAEHARRETGLSLQYADVNAAYAAALQAGAVAVTPPEQREGEPIMLGSLEDPEGNVIMLTQFMGY